MDENDDLNDMLQCAMFDHIKEMLLCMDSFSCSDKKMAEIINLHGGLDKYFKQLKERYIVFLQKNKE